MVPPRDEDLYATMVAAVDGAEGLRSDWLEQQAADGERYRLQVIGLQDFINSTWESRPDYGFIQ